jgi:hypothetical protein
MKNEKPDTRQFLAGLVNWHGENMPSASELDGKAILDSGYTHIKAITETGGEIRGEMKPCWKFAEIAGRSDSTPTWGYNVVRVLAEKYFLSNTAH